MSGAAIAVREATPDDAERVADLLTQLAYPATPAQARERLVLASGRTEMAVRVAELGGEVVGLAVGEIARTFHRPEPLARLAALVVDERVRGRGAGRALVAWFEAWAADQGATRGVLTSANRRLEAHAFYRSLGWEATGLRFAKDFAPQR